MNRKAQYAQAWRQSLIDRGMCTRCASKPARPGRRTCQRCADHVASARQTPLATSVGNYHGPQPDYVAQPLRAAKLALLAVKAKAELPLFDGPDECASTP